MMRRSIEKKKKRVKFDNFKLYLNFILHNQIVTNNWQIILCVFQFNNLVLV